MLWYIVSSTAHRVGLWVYGCNCLHQNLSLAVRNDEECLAVQGPSVLGLGAQGPRV